MFNKPASNYACFVPRATTISRTTFSRSAVDHYTALLRAILPNLTILHIILVSIILLSFCCHSGKYHSAVIVLSLCCHWAVILLSFWQISFCYHSAVILLSFCCHSAVTVLSFCCHSAAVLLPFCCRSAVILLSFCFHSAVILLSFCCHAADCQSSDSCSINRPSGKCHSSKFSLVNFNMLHAILQESFKSALIEWV
jgi:hypothetical protein